jgi:hypothetical protein
MAYLRNSIIDFDQRVTKITDINGSGALKNYDLEDYQTLNLIKVFEYVESCNDNLFTWHQLQNNDKLEKVSLDLYNNPDYWDILLVINRRNPLIELPYDTDTLLEFAARKTENYINDVYGKDISQETLEVLTATYEKKFIEDAEKFRVIRIVKPEKIHDFLQKGYEEGCFN